MINENDNAPIVNALAAAMEIVLPLVEQVKERGTHREPFTLFINGRPVAVAVLYSPAEKKFMVLGDWTQDVGYRLSLDTADCGYVVAFLAANSQAFHDAINRPETRPQPADLTYHWR